MMDINEGSVNVMSTSLILEMDASFILFVSLVRVVGITPTDNFLLTLLPDSGSTPEKNFTYIPTTNIFK